MEVGYYEMGGRATRNVRWFFLFFYFYFYGAERWKASELCKDALTKPQVCTQLTSVAVGSKFVFVGAVE